MRSPPQGVGIPVQQAMSSRVHEGRAAGGHSGGHSVQAMHALRVLHVQVLAPICAWSAQHPRACLAQEAAHEDAMQALRIEHAAHLSQLRAEYEARARELAADYDRRTEVPRFAPELSTCAVVDAFGSGRHLQDPPRRVWPPRRIVKVSQCSSSGQAFHTWPCPLATDTSEWCCSTPSSPQKWFKSKLISGGASV